MFESKYRKVLTVILVIVIIAIIGLLAWLAYDWYNKYVVNKDAGNFVDDFIGEVDGEGDSEVGDGELNGVDDAEISGGSGLKTYKGFVVLGTIEIPKTGIKYPVLEKVTTKSMEAAVAMLFGSGLNQPGNTVIIGHNYRNGMFFSDNKKLSNGDKIYITDNSGKKISYTIYDKFQTTPEDSSFYQRDTNGIPEVTLSTCTDDTKNRLIIEARADEESLREAEQAERAKQNTENTEENQDNQESQENQENEQN